MTDALRDALRDCLQADSEAFERLARRIADEYSVDVDLSAVDSIDDVSKLPPAIDRDALDARERTLIRRLRCFDTIPLGLTLSGPAYRDNPLLYANETFRTLTGYSMPELYGENPRLLQGPDTESAAVADLYEAIDIWESTTVDLWNYRADGSRFRNRVSLVPLTDDTGMVTNWLGIQERVPADSGATDRHS